MCMFESWRRSVSGGRDDGIVGHVAICDSNSEFLRQGDGI